MNLPRVQFAIGEHQIQARVARTSEERALGLMFRTELDENEGMLFWCEESTVQSFWMKDTPVALSIAFIADDGTIVKIADLEPCSLEGESSEEPVRFVLEVPQGWFAQRGIAAGARLAGPLFLERV